MLPPRSRFLAFLVPVGLWISAGAVLAEPPTTADNFDVSRGAVVTSHSAVVSSAPEDMFGAMSGGVENGTMLFADASQGTVDFIEWSLPAPITLEGFNLYGTGNAPDAPERRTFDHFRLRAKVGSDFVTLYDADVKVPYSFIEQPSLVVSSGVNSVSASQFRAEFRQHAKGSPSGPRVIELDGFSGQSCGDANDSDTVTASDALVTLRAAVGSAACAYCVCDVDSSGSISAADALTVLKRSVGANATFSCAPCFYPKSQKTTTTSTVSSSSSSSVSIP